MWSFVVEGAVRSRDDGCMVGGCSLACDWLQSNLPTESQRDRGTATTAMPKVRLEKVKEDTKAYWSQTIASAALLDDGRGPWLLLRPDNHFTNLYGDEWPLCRQQGELTLQEGPDGCGGRSKEL